MTISFSGLASGLDTSSWVESLVALKRAKVTTLQEQKQELVVSKDTLSSIKSFFTSFRSTIEKITKSPFNMVQMDLFAQNVATSANLNVLTATATPEAEEGTYRVKVDKLATKTSATSNKKYTTTIVETTTATADSKLKNIGVRAGNIAVDVNGIKYGISITDTDTIATFIDKLKNIGVEAGFNETTGVFTMKANASDIDDIDNTGIVEKLHLTDVNEGYETSNKLLVDKVETKVEIADANTSLKDLGLSSGTFQVSANGETYDIEINVDDTDATDTLGELVAALQANDIDARLSNGVFTINDAVITSEGTTNIITAMGLSEDVYTKSQQSKELSVETTAIATAGTKLSDIGDGVTINDGDTVIVKNSNNVQTEIVLQEESTIGDLLAAISNAGLYAAINNDGTIEISGGQIVGGTFDAVEVFGLESEPANAMVTGNNLTETVVEHKIVDLETKLVDDLGVTEGYLEVTDADGNKYYEKIYSGQTIADFMADMGNLGIYTSLDEETGILEITGGAFRTLDNDNDEVGSLIANGTIVETDPNFPATGTNLLECLYGSPVITTGQIEVASAYSRTRALSRTITNTVNATTDTTLGALGLTIEGTAEFNVRGDIRTIDITSTMTIEELQNALTAQGIESAWDSDNSRLTINNATLEGGTSDLADVLNLEETIAGKYTTSDALYATNNYSAEATRESFLSEYGISAEEEVLVYAEGLAEQTITVSGSTSLGTLLDTLNTMGVTATLANGILNIEDGYLVNANLETALGLTRRTSGSSHILGNQVTYTVTTAVTGTSELGDVISALGTESEVAGGYSLVFNTTTLAVDSSTTLNGMIEQINAAGGSARLDSTGRIHVEGGALTGTVAEALGFATTTITTAVSATGEELKTTITMLADETTTFGELGITEDGSITVRDSSGNSVGTINITADMTLKEFFNELGENDINASIKDGKITLESISGNYLEGDIAETLGIAFDDMSFDVSTITTGMTATSTVAVTYLSTIHATGTTTLDDLGVVLNDIDSITGFTNEVTQLTQAEAEAAGYTWVTDRAGLTTALTNNENIVLGADIDLSGGGDWTPISTYSGTLDGNGYVIKNMTVTTGGLIATLNGTIQNLGFENTTVTRSSYAGVLASTSNGATVENCYVANSSVRSSRGGAGALIGSATSTTVSSTNVINVLVSCSYSNGQSGGLIGSANSVTVSGGNVIDCNISTSSTSPNSGYGAGGIIGRVSSDGATISDSRVYNTQVNALQAAAGGAIGGVYNSDVTISNTEVNCQAIGQRAGNLLGYIRASSSYVITLENNSYNSSNGLASYGGKSFSYTTITESGTTAYLGFGNDLTVHNAFGDSIGTINLEGTSSINDIFSALATYGISGKINNGEIILTSADGNFIAGEVARQLGINIVESGSAISTTNFAQTSSSKVTYTTTLNIDGTETLADLGIYTGSGFVKEVDRMTKAEAEAAGYTWVTDRAGLTSAMNNDDDIVLGADIDMSGSNWTPIAYYDGVLDGNGHVIKNMTVSTSGNTCTAFIHTGSFCTIKNLGFENANVTNDATVGQVAVVIAYSDESISINNCYIDNSTVSGGGNTAGFIGCVVSGVSINNSVVGDLAIESSSTPYLFAYSPNYDAIFGSNNYYASSNTASKINSGQTTFSASSYTPGEGILVNDSAGNTLGTLNITGTTTIDNMLAQLEAYGIGSSIENGVISLYSSDGKYVSGSVAERLGLKVANRITQTVTAVATTTSTMADLGVNTSNPKFVNAITRMTQAEAEAAGYTWVTDRAGLTTALTNNENIVLGADIDLSDADWSSMDYQGILDGNGYAIKNMTAIYGFIYTLENSTIKNLGFENATVNSGGLSGTLANAALNSTIENCYVDNSQVNSTANAAVAVGGLVGYTDGGALTIKDSRVYNSTVNGYVAGGVIGDVYSGGILTVINTSAYNTSVHGTGWAGGFTGAFEGAQVTLDNVNLDVEVTCDTTNAGSIIGGNYQNNVAITNCSYSTSMTNPICGIKTVEPIINNVQQLADVGQNSAGIGLGVLDKSGNLLGTINVNSTTSIGDLFTQLSAYGIAGSIDENGVITLSSADGKTVGGTVADDLGLTVTQRLTQTVTAVATTTSTMADLGVKNPKFVNAITRKTQAEAVAAGYTWVTDRAGLESALAVNGAKIMLGADIDLGDSLWAGAGSVDIDYSYELDGNGYVIKNMNTESGFFKNIDSLILKNVGFENATVNTSISGYIGCAGVIASTVESGEITNCYVSNSSVTATIMNVGALIGASYGNETGNVVIDACNIYESAITTNGNAAGGIVGLASSSSIEITNSNVYSSTITGIGVAGGIIGVNQSSSSVYNCNIDATIACNDATKSGAIIGIISQPVTIGNVNYSSNLDSAVYGSASAVVPTVSNVQQLDDVGQNSAGIGLGVLDKSGNLLGTINVNSTTSIGDLFTQLSAYGIAGSIDQNGVITLSSSDGKTISGAVADQLGLTVTQRLTQTVTAVATTTSKMEDMGVDTSNPKFVNAITRMTQTEAETAGYTWVTDRAGLTTAMNNDDDIVLGADIDLSGENWDPISSYIGILDGNGYAIKNMSVDSGPSKINVAFIDTLYGTVKNLGFDNASVTGEFDRNAGVVAGYAEAAIVENCYVANSNVCNRGPVAAIIGSACNMIVESCYVENTVIPDGLCNSVMVGYNDDSITEINNYFYNVTIGSEIVPGGLSNSLRGIMVFDKNGDRLGEIDVNSTTSIGDLFTQLSAYGIAGSIDENGVITLSSADGKTVGGTVADQLGLTVTQRLVQTVTAVATTTSTMGDLGVDTISNPKFVNAITRMTQAEAEAAGYTWVTDRAGLTSALKSYKNIVLGADIDLSGENWDPISWYHGILDGNGYVIKNMTISAEGAGFVYDLDEIGSIKNLGFENANVESVSSAGVVAYSSSGTIENCYVDNSFVYGASQAGVIVASASGIIDSCYVANTTLEGDSTGGIASWIYDGTISNSILYNVFSNGTSCAGGVLSQGEDVTISNVHVKAKVNESVDDSGIIVGALYDSPFDISNVIYDSSLSPNAQLYGGSSSSLTESNINAGTVNPLAWLYINDKTGNCIAELNVNSTTSIGDLFTQLSAYGIAGSIDSNGVITLNSSNGNYIAGALADQLGIGTVATGNTILVGSTATSGDKVICMTEKVATLDSKVLDFAHSSTVIDGTITASSGVSGNAIAISTAEDLVNLANWVNAGNNTLGKSFYLTNDINLASIENWTSIGNAANAFSGKFDGQGYTIYNLNQTIPETPGATVYAGLFGNTYNATLTNFNLENVNITGTIKDASTLYLGAAVGYIAGSNAGINFIEAHDININIYRDHTGANSSYVGGIAGYSSAYYIHDLEVYSGSINYDQTSNSSYNYTGGVFGEVSPYSSLSDLYNAADVSGVTYAGGVAGRFNNVHGVTLQNSANTGSVDAKYAGGLLGEAYGGSSATRFSINNSYNTGTITGEYNSDSVGHWGGVSGIDFNSCGALTSLAPAYSPNGTHNYYTSYIGQAAIESAFSDWQSIDGALVPGTDSESIRISSKIGNSVRATITVDATTTFADLFEKLGEYSINCSLEDGRISIACEGDYYARPMSSSILSQLGFTSETSSQTIPKTCTSTVAVTYTETIAAQASTTLGELNQYKYKIDGTISASGVNGTVIGISTVADLQNLANLVNAGNTMSGKTFVLTNDIDLSSVDNWTSIGGYSSGTLRSFNGTFDGQGYTISNLTQNSEITTSNGATESLSGLFGHVNGATIKNLTLSNFNITTVNNNSSAYASRVGALIGQMAAGTVSGITVENLNINAGANSEVGGIIGFANAGTILNSSTSGTISCATGAGILGRGGIWNGNLKIDNCQNNANITTTANLGGIVGSITLERDVEITNVLNKGTLTSGSISSCAGIIGRAESYSNIAVDFTLTNAVNIAKVTNSASTSRDIMYATGTLSASSTVTIDNCYGYYTSTTSTTSAINIANWSGVTLGTVQNNLSLSTIGTNLRNSGCDLEKWSLGTGTSTLNLKTGDDYDMFVYNSTTGVLTEKVDLNAGSSLQYVATALNDRGDVVITGNELSYVPTYATMAVTGTGAQILNTPLTTTTLATMTSDTTIAELGITGNTTITVKALGTNGNILVTVASSETVGDVMTKLAAYGFESKIDNGKLTVKSADNDYYISGATPTLETALKINFGSDVSYYPSGTVYATTTDGRQLVGTELTELSSDSTIESLGISTDAYITINSNGTEYVHTLAASQTLGDMMNILSAYGIASSISDGKLTIYSNSNACIQGMDDRLLASLNLGSNDNLNEQIAEVRNTSSNQLQSKTVSVSTQMTSDSLKFESTSVSTQMTSNSLESERISSSMSSNTLTIQETSTLGFETKFSELGISDTNFITINSNGIYSTVTIEATDTVGEMLSALAGYGILGSIEDGKITVKGNKDDYITDISDNLASKIKLDFDVNDFTYDVVYSNTSSNTLGIEGTATINSDTTFAELGATNDNFITVVTAGTEHVITVRATNTVGEILANLSAYGIAGTIEDGKVVLTPTGYNYVKDMSDDLEGYLHIAEPYYSETSGSVGTATSDEFIEINTINAITTTQLRNLVDELGIAPSGYDIEITSISAAGTDTYTHTFAATDTVQDVIDKLREYGITATLNPEGRFDMASTVLTDFEVAGSLGEYLMGNYVDTKVYNETNTQNVSSILSQETDTLMTDSTKLSDIGITDGEIQISINDEIKTITVDSTSTIADFRIQLADIGLSSNLIDGRISIVTDKNVSFITPVDGSNAVTILGLNNISSETEYSQTSKWLGDTGTSEGAAGMDTMISQLKDSSGNLLGITSGKVYVYQDGTRSVININTNETLNDLATKLSQYGITMGISSNGVLYFDGDNNSYLTTEGLASGEASNLLEKIGVNTEWNTRYNSTSETLDFEEQENTTVNGSTLLSDLQDSSGNNLGITEGNYYVYQNGVRNTESISADTTVNDFIATLSTYGMTATFDENGSLSVGADSNTYLATAATAGANTNAIDVLFEEWNFTNIYTSNGLDVPTDVTVAISETTKLADINEKDGSGNGYQAGYITVVKDGVQTDIELTADDTVGDLMDELALYGFESVINANGQLIIKNTGDSRLQAYNGAGVKSNALEILGVRNEDWISTNAYQGSILEATSTDKVAATRDTLLSDLGITTGEYYVYNNGVKYTALISSDETVGSLMDTLKSFGLETSLTTSADGTKSVIKILGNGDAYIAKSTSVSGSANIEELFELTTTNSYSYSGIQETSELVTSQVNATEDTLLSTYDDVPNGKTAEGNLSITIDGVDSIVCVEADETIGSLIHKFEALGLEADYIDGNIVIQSGYKDFTINTDGTNPTDSNILDTIGLVYNDNLGNYLASSNIVEQTTSEETVLTLSAANFATDDTTFDLLSITTGTLSIYRDGQKATVTVESEKTFAQFKQDVKDCFGDVEVDIDEKGFLYFKSTNPGVKVEVGATTDTSNFAAITGITNDGSGVVKSARELYCVNSSSIITTSGIFRDGDVKAGTFTVGEEEFTITNTTTISDIISQINASQKAKATAYWDSVDGKFVIQSRTTGSSLINIEAGTSNFTDVMGFTTSEWTDGDGDGDPDIGDAEASVTKLKVESQEIGENAVFSINGTYYTSTSNTIDSSVSRIKGLTIDLKGVSEGGETTITVERDKETLANAVSDVVDAYNALIEGVDKEIAKGSPLDDQFTLKLLRNQIRNMMTNSFAGLGAFQNLDQIGIVLDKATAGNISTDRIDTLTFDKDKFFDAYNADRDSLKSILVGTESVKGIFSQLEENVLGNALKYASGYFSSAEKSYNNQIQRLNAKIEKEQKAVERYKERLEAKFASMDLLISQMQSQFSSFLGT